jgi:hypothetical protein
MLVDQGFENTHLFCWWRKITRFGNCLGRMIRTGISPFVFNDLLWWHVDSGSKEMWYVSFGVVTYKAGSDPNNRGV